MTPTSTRLTEREGVRHVEAHARHIDVKTLSFAQPSELPEPVIVPLRSAAGVNRVLYQRKVALGAALGERLVAQLIEQCVERHGEVLAVVRLGPFDHVQVWVGNERFREWTDGVLSDLIVPPPNLLDPSPDLVDVDLASGRLAASDGFEMRWVEWDLDQVEAQAMMARLGEALPALFEALELGGVPTLGTFTERTLDPMDGSVPPNCPFTDTTTQRGGDVVLRLESVQWDEDSVHSSSVRLSRNLTRS